jgi:hypothetical protein
MRMINYKPVYEDPNDINITNRAILALLIKDGFAPLQRAFDEQNADIAMVNLSLSSYGWMLSTGLIADSSFSLTMTTALDMVKDKEKAVIFYTLPTETINGIFAICFKRSIVDKIGLYRLGSKKSLPEFAAYVNGLKLESSNGVANGCSCCSTMPMFFTRREPDHIIRTNFLYYAIPALQQNIIINWQDYLKYVKKRDTRKNENV